jgi:hypothetical protein
MHLRSSIILVLAAALGAAAAGDERYSQFTDKLTLPCKPA